MQVNDGTEVCPTCLSAASSSTIKAVAPLRKQLEELRTVLQSLISCGGTSPLIKAMAMNVLEADSGDAWLRARQQTSNTTETK